MVHFAPEREVLDFLLNSKPGDHIVYAGAISLPACSHRGVDRIRAAYNDGTVDLCQRREDEGFSYIAQKRSRPAKVADHGRFQGVK